MFCHLLIDPVYRIQQITDRSIMVEGINDQGDVFAHVAIYIVWLLKQLVCLINQIGGQEAVKVPVLVCVVEAFQSVCKQAKGSAHKDFGGPSFL